eukprot:SAG31_NODE_5840_length_2301_cov_2.850136_1_plen_191_part_00
MSAESRVSTLPRFSCSDSSSGSRTETDRALLTSSSHVRTLDCWPSNANAAYGGMMAYHAVDEEMSPKSAAQPVAPHGSLSEEEIDDKQAIPKESSPEAVDDHGKILHLTPSCHAGHWDSLQSASGPVPDTASSWGPLHFDNGAQIWPNSLTGTTSRPLTSSTRPYTGSHGQPQSTPTAQGMRHGPSTTHV